MNPVRGLYSLLWGAALPLAPLRLLWRGRREPGYREHMAERYGRYRSAAPPRIIWVHAVSLGETRAAAPLVLRLRRAHPDATLLLTHMTATGREAGRALFGDGVLQAWLPYDAPFAVRRFLAHFQPCAGLLLETELWPNLVALSREAGVPIYLVNARMSARSARLYAAFPALTRPMFGALSGVAAQTDADAARLAALGAPAAVVTGNLKFDAIASDAGETLGREFRARFGEARPVWVAASTRDGEEALILDALAARALPAGTLTVIVPRHPQRFAAVAELLRRRGIPFVLRSSNAARDRPTSKSCSATRWAKWRATTRPPTSPSSAAACLPLGGQNLIEPIARGTPDAHRAAHVQFRRSGGEGAGSRRRRRGRRRRRSWSRPSRRCWTTRRAGRRCARPRSRFTARTTAPRTAWRRGSRRASTPPSPRGATPDAA